MPKYAHIYMCVYVCLSVSLSLCVGLSMCTLYIYIYITVTLSITLNIDFDNFHMHNSQSANSYTEKTDKSLDAVRMRWHIHELINLVLPSQQTRKHFIPYHIPEIGRRSLCGVVANVPNCDIVVAEFELQLQY